MMLVAVGVFLGWLLGLGVGVWLALLNDFDQGPFSGALIMMAVPCLIFTLAGLAAALFLLAMARFFPPSSQGRTILQWPGFTVAALIAGFLVWALNGIRYGKEISVLRQLLGLSWVALAPALVLFAAARGRHARPKSSRFFQVAGLVLPALFFVLAAGDYFWRIHRQVRVLGELEMQLAPPFVPTGHPLPEPNGQRVIVLGLDAATWDRIDPLIQQGRLPNFQRLKAEGAAGRLKTLIPTWSTAIWTTIATGQPPEVHGIEDMFVEQAPLLGRGEMRFPLVIRGARDVLRKMKLIRKVPMTNVMRRTKALWNMASEAGRTVDVVGWWASWPPEAINGIMVSDRANYVLMQSWERMKRLYNLPAGTYTYPPEFLVQLEPFQRDLNRLSPEELEPFARLDDEDREKLRHLEQLDREDPVFQLAGCYLPDTFYLETSRFILQSRSSDLGLFYFKTTLDSSGHFFGKFNVEGQPWSVSNPKFQDTVDAFYDRADAMLGEFMALVDDRTTLVVVSDHGFQIEPEDYGHTLAPDGIIAILGAQARPGAHLASAHVYDLAPTILFLLGLPAGQDMPGRVLEEGIAPERLSRRAPRIPSWETVPRSGTGLVASGQEDAIMHQLRALGYIK